jgi:hypothetical protein
MWTKIDNSATTVLAMPTTTIRVGFENLLVDEIGRNKINVNYTDNRSRYRSITNKQVNMIVNAGMNNKLINCRRLMKPMAEIKMSPQARPPVSTRVALYEQREVVMTVSVVVDTKTKPDTQS